MGFFRAAGLIAAKDLRVEWRSREILYTVTFFAALLVVVFSFSFARSPRVVPLVAPGMLWVTVAFAGTVGLSRAFDREREGDTLRALLLSPVPRLALFVGKAIAVFALVLLVALVALPLLALLLEVSLLAAPLHLLALLLLGTAGFAIIGTVFAATLLKVRARDVLLPVIMYPLLMPLFIAATSGTRALVVGVPDLQSATNWIGFLAAYDAAFALVSLWLFEDLVIE